MKEFSHVAPPLRLHHGEQALKRLSRDMDRAGVRRALLITGRTLGAGGPVLDRVQTALEGRITAIWNGVQPHSPLPSVLAAARALEESGADAVVALGGGSAIVTARAAAIALAEGSDLHRLATHRDADGQLRSPRLAAPKLPQFAIPTTPSTAAVKAGSAVLDPAQGLRLALFDPGTRAQSVALDPLALASAPGPLVIDAALNTLTLAIEGVLSPGADPFAEAFLLQAIRLIGAGLAQDRHDPAELAIAAALAGRGTDHAGAGIATVLAHALSAQLSADQRLSHGALNAMLLPEALRFNAEHAPGPITRVAKAMGCSDGAALLALLAALPARLNLPTRLGDLAIPESALPDAAERALDDWFLAGSPRKVTHAAELAAILHRLR